MQIQVTNIDWDTDGEDVDLPQSLLLDTEAEGIEAPEQDLPGWLSDRYGWTVNGVSFEPASSPGCR